MERIIEVKEGRKWTQAAAENDAEIIYDNLAHDLISKIEGRKYIKSVRRTQNYDGTITITVTYYDTFKNTADTRSRYTVPNTCMY